MATSAPVDPRSVITPDAFTVAPHLIGVQLASPWRRGAAMLLDFIPLAILVAAGGSVLLGLIAASMLWRASSHAQNQGFIKAGAKAALRVSAALVAFLVVTRLIGWVTNDDDRDEDADVDGSGVVTNVEGLTLSFRDLAILGPVAGLQAATDSVEAAAHADEIAAWLAANESDPDVKRDVVTELLADLQGPMLRAATPAFAPFLTDPAPATDSDSVLVLYARAIESGDTIAADSLRTSAVAAVAGDSLRRAERRNERLRDENDELEEALEEERDRGSGIIGFLRGISDDLGIGFGWTAVYFTSFLALWQGQTPGKRMVGVRVIRLDGRPMTWWLAFERFGGYAASLSTGLLGFLQILWDRNRQGLHDKGVETVVVREPDFRGRIAARDEA